MSYRHFVDVKCIKFIVLCELRKRLVSALGKTFSSQSRISGVVFIQVNALKTIPFPFTGKR